MQILFKLVNLYQNIQNFSKAQIQMIAESNKPSKVPLKT